jgi:hypothetical protein
VIPVDLLSDVERARDLVRILRRGETADYYHNLGRIFGLTRALDDEVRKNYLSDRELVNALDLAHAKAWEIADRHCVNRDLILVQLDADLEVARARVRVIVRRLSIQYANEINRQRSAGGRKAYDNNVSGPAKALSRMAVRILPADYRQRYSDEYWSELFDLQNGPRWRQLVYALQLIIRTPMLRRELHGQVEEYSESERHDQLASRPPHWVRSRR